MPLPSAKVEVRGGTWTQPTARSGASFRDPVRGVRRLPGSGAPPACVRGKDRQLRVNVSQRRRALHSRVPHDPSANDKPSETPSVSQHL